MTDAAGNSYGPYDIDVTGSQAEPLSEAAWYRLNRQSGILSGANLTFSGLTLQLSALNALVHGSWLERDDPWTDATPPTTTSAPRRDLLVARRQLTTGEGSSGIPGQTFLTVIRGTPSTTPVDPAHDPVNDERLWSFQVPGSGGTTVTGLKDWRRGLYADGPTVASAPGGLLGYREFVGTVPLNNTPTGLPAFDLTGITIPPNRRVRAKLSGSLVGTTAGTAYGLLLYMDGQLVRRGSVKIAQPTGTPQFFGPIDKELTPAAGVHTFTVAGGLTGGSGTFSIAADSTFEQAWQFTVEDIGCAI